MHADREHVISVVLSHDEWTEFVRLQPQPAAWLRERIQEMIAAQGSIPSEVRDNQVGVSLQ